MPLVYACIAPHGGHLLDADDRSPVARCRAAMLAMGRRMTESGATTLVVLTPHGVYVEGVLTLSLGLSAYGEADSGVSVSAPLDQDFAVALGYQASVLGVPIAPVASSKPGGEFPLDWGAAIPLALLAGDAADAQIVVGCPARDLPRPQLVAIGMAVVEAAAADRRAVALIVSADQGHGHAIDGPYGYSPRSAEYDNAMMAAVRENDIERLLGWDETWIDDAMPDSYWQTLSLIGVQRALGWPVELLAYDIDHYFGLMCAEMRPPA